MGLPTVGAAAVSGAMTARRWGKDITPNDLCWVQECVPISHPGLRRQRLLVGAHHSDRPCLRRTAVKPPPPPLSGRPVEAPFPVRDEAPLPGFARIPGAGISGQLHITVRGPRLTKIRSIFLSGISARSWLTQ